MRILSGVKPTGRPHLGNYFGAIRQFVDLQNRGEGYYFVADLHALDEIRDRERLTQLSFDVAVDYLAFGIDPAKDNGFHSFLKDANGAVVDASTGRVSNGCIRTGDPEAIFAYAEIGMPVWVHW